MTAQASLDELFAQVLTQLRSGRAAAAEQLCRQILQRDRQNADALHFLGVLALQSGQGQRAAALIRAAIALQGRAPSYYSNLGAALRGLGRFGEAVAVYGRALALDPRHPEIHYNLGVALIGMGAFDRAELAGKRTLALAPDHAKAFGNLGTVHLEQGRLTEADTALRRSLALQPDQAETGANLVFAQLYRFGVGAEDLLAAARQWSRRHAGGVEACGPDRRRPGAGAGPPRIGLVSADFRSHPVGFLVAPALEALARAGHDLTCYANSGESDAVSARIARSATRWRPVAALDDDALAEQVRADAIDILIDLSGFSAGNRLALFARKPAPLQIAGWLGYPGTSGMAAMDYLLADPWLIPPGAERFYSEAVVRLPCSYALFAPPAEAPPVGDPPCRSGEPVTFGSFNMLKKISPECVSAWSRLLARLPASRLLVKAKALDNPATRQRLCRAFARHGVGAERLILIGASDRRDHLAAMALTDIALDSFPYSGGQTTLECLWMGLPVVTLPGQSFSSRHCLGYLGNIGLAELAAADIDAYLEIAVALAADPDRLASLRAGLRARLRSSPLCDGDRFAGHLGAALTTMWRRWCEGEAATAFDVPKN